MLVQDALAECQLRNENRIIGALAFFRDDRIIFSPVVLFNSRV